MNAEMRREAVRPGVLPVGRWRSSSPRDACALYRLQHELMHENEIGEAILRCAIRVHRALGPGLLESAYETCLAFELLAEGQQFTRQFQVPIRYRDRDIDMAFRIDLLVGGRVVVEVKAVEQLLPVHEAQLLSYLRLGHYKLGYLLNFNVPILKQGIRRKVNGL